VKKITKYFVSMIFIFLGLVLTFSNHHYVQKSVLFFTDRYNDEFCFSNKLCFDLPKGYLVIVSGKDQEEKIYGSSWFINKNIMIDNKVAPETIHLSLFKPESKDNSIDIYGIKNINQELKPLLQRYIKNKNENIFYIQTSNQIFIYLKTQKIKFVINKMENEPFKIVKKIVSEITESWGQKVGKLGSGHQYKFLEKGNLVTPITTGQGSGDP